MDKKKLIAVGSGILLLILGGLLHMDVKALVCSPEAPVAAE